MLHSQNWLHQEKRGQINSHEGPSRGKMTSAYDRNTDSILIVDDEKEVLESLEMILNSGGYEDVVACADSREVLPLLADSLNVRLVLLDLVMPYLTGEYLLQAIHDKYPELPVIVITALGDLETAVKSMKSGAFDYLVKPVEKMRMLSTVRLALDRLEMARENRALKERLLNETLTHPEAFEAMITRNARMLSIFQYVEAISPSPEAVLVTGETGVGKELIARAIHKISGRKGEFVAVSIAGLDDVLFSDTLFGHLKGAFTGALSRREGLIQKAAGGTLFLDEIGQLDPSSQIKLLRLLQEREYFPLGADVPQKGDARIIAATNHNIADEKSENFRRDLFYRLQTHHVHLPPLRDRKEDIPLLIEHFVKKASYKLGKKIPSYPGELSVLLSCYNFPGNVRELEAIIFDAVSKGSSRMLSLESFKERIFKRDPKGNWPTWDDPAAAIFSSNKILPTLNQAREALVAEAMKRSKGSQTIAARLLGISQPALSRWLKSRSYVPLAEPS